MRLCIYKWVGKGSYTIATLSEEKKWNIYRVVPRKDIACGQILVQQFH